MCASCFPEKGVCTSQYCCIVHTLLCLPCTVCCFAWNGFVAVWNLKRFTRHVWCLCKLQNKFFNGLLYNSVVKWHWETEVWKTAAIIYCRHQQQRAYSRTAQVSDDLRGPTCIADQDSGALALTNAQNRPALLQLNSLWEQPCTALAETGGKYWGATLQQLWKPVSKLWGRLADAVQLLSK